MDVLEWLRATRAEFEFDVVAAYRFVGSRASVQAQIGNSVPPLLA